MWGIILRISRQIWKTEITYRGCFAWREISALYCKVSDHKMYYSLCLQNEKLGPRQKEKQVPTPLFLSPCRGGNNFTVKKLSLILIHQSIQRMLSCSFHILCWSFNTDKHWIQIENARVKRCRLQSSQNIRNSNSLGVLFTLSLYTA